MLWTNSASIQGTRSQKNWTFAVSLIYRASKTYETPDSGQNTRSIKTSSGFKDSAISRPPRTQPQRPVSGRRSWLSLCKTSSKRKLLRFRSRNLRKTQLKYSISKLRKRRIRRPSRGSIPRWLSRHWRLRLQPIRRRAGLTWVAQSPLLIIRKHHRLPRQWAKPLGL